MLEGDAKKSNKKKQKTRSTNRKKQRQNKQIPMVALKAIRNHRKIDPTINVGAATNLAILPTQSSA
jgi:hypothetical protein